MTSDNISAIETVEKAMEGVKRSRWFMSPWHAEEDASAVRNQSDGSYICNASSDSFAAYLAACNPVAMSAILAEARKAEALKREVAELREALRPFAAVAEHDIGNDETDAELFCPMTRHNRAPRLTVGDIRRTLLSLAQSEEVLL